MTERDDLISYIWDAYKDLHGIRPRFMNFDAMSIEDLRKEADFLSESIGAEIRRAREHNEAVYAALDDPDCLVVLCQPYADEYESGDEFYRHYVIGHIARDDLSIFRVYRQEPAPANTALADALRAAIGG